MYVCMLLAVVTMVGWKLAGTSSIRTRRYGDYSRALALAEGGVARMYENLEANPDAWVGRAFTNAIGPGEYVVTATRKSPTLVHIESTGVVNNVKASTAFEVLTSTYGTLSGDIVFSGIFGIIADGNITLDTTAIDIYGSVHANGNIFNVSGNPRVFGDMSASGFIQVPPQPGYQAVSNAPHVLVPDHDPFDPWKALAQSGGMYITGNYVMGNKTVQPGNGVLYCEGDIRIRNRSEFVGTLVARGSIIIENHFKQSRSHTNWPSMLAGGNIELLNRNNYTGAMYACGNFTSFNNKQINGPIFARGNIEIRNNADVVPPPGPTMIDPNQQWVTATDVDKGGWIR